MRAVHTDIGQGWVNFRAMAGKAIFLCAWMALMFTGFKVLARHDLKAGSMGPVSPLPPGLEAGDRPFSLVLALHPRCPCSRATVDELCQIYSRAPQNVRVSALVFALDESADDWLESDTIAALRRMGARLIIDTNGMIASSMGFGTSGQVRVYTRGSELVYDGGITGSRGHRGDNEGKVAVLELIRDGATLARATPPFGCSLSSP